MFADRLHPHQTNDRNSHSSTDSIGTSTTAVLLTSTRPWAAGVDHRRQLQAAVARAEGADGVAAGVDDEVVPTVVGQRYRALVTSVAV